MSKVAKVLCAYAESAKKTIAHIKLSKRKINYVHQIKSCREIEIITGVEELVRAALITKLVNELGYKVENIEIEKEYNIGRPKVKKARIDVIVKDEKDSVFFFMEVKAPNKFESDQQFIEGQLFQLAKLENRKIKYLVYYTIDVAENSKMLEDLIIIDYEKYPTYEEWQKSGFESASYSLPERYEKAKKEPFIKGGVRDLQKDFSVAELNSLRKRLHNVLWGGGGIDDNEVFASITNIILAKIQDEDDTDEGEQYKFQVITYGEKGEEKESPEDVFERVNKLYRDALQEKFGMSEKEAEKQNIVDLSRFTLNKLIFAIQELQKYSFVEGRATYDGKDILGDFFEGILRDGFKQSKGQFFTSINLIRFILYALKIDDLAIYLLNNYKELPYIIDPSAGSNSFLVEATKMITLVLKYKRKSEIKNSKAVQAAFNDFFMNDSNENKWAKDHIYSIDINFNLGTAGKVNMILHGGSGENSFVKDGLLPFRFYRNEQDKNRLLYSEESKIYYSKEVNGKFTILISNPPFNVDLDKDTKHYLGKEFLFGDKKNSENLFVERWYQLLEEDGRLGVILPESIFDTSENKYIRLFIYKYFYVKAIVSLPALSFEPYTSTKTSILFAQKKRESDVNAWNAEWSNASMEYEYLKTRVNNYVNVYLNGANPSRYPSIKDHDEETALTNTKRYLKNVISEEDQTLGIKELLLKYKEKIDEISRIDKDLTEYFGYVNTQWVFAEVMNSLKYDILYDEVENVGYKRTLRGENTNFVNELFDVEAAPNSINKTEIIDKFQEELTGIVNELEEMETRKAEIENYQEKNKDEELKGELNSLIADISKKIDELDQAQKDLDEAKSALEKYYTEEGILKEEYYDRLDNDLINIFTNGILSEYVSNDVLIRKNSKVKTLDFIRHEVKWRMRGEAND